MKFVAFERAKQGTGASRRLRNSGRTPGIVYGSTLAPQLIELDHNALWHALKKEGFHASILDMEFNGESSKVLLRDYQMHPYKQLVQHIDFQRVDANTTLHMKVPLHFSGEEESEAVKTDKCTVNQVVTELETQEVLVKQSEALTLCVVVAEKDEDWDKDGVRVDDTD
jgi:large subunit ribosomal protein L25